MKNRVALTLLMFALCLGSVSAYSSHLNVTISEVVYRNITFAENFFLNENVTFCIINGTLNVTNIGSESVFDIHIQFANTENLVANFTWNSNTKFGNQSAGTPGETIVVHIPSLRPGNYSTYTYQISCVNVTPPLDIVTTYTNPDHGLNRKVLAGYNWTVTQSVTNDNYLQRDMNNINITIQAQQVQWNTSLFNFSLEFLYPLGDHKNVTGNGTSDTDWWWDPLDGTMVYNQTANISYRVRAPFSVPFTATYRALLETITYDVDFLISNLSLEYINASAAVNFSFEKRISQPADNENSHNVTWHITPQVTSDLDIAYDVNKVTLWVTENLDPTNKTNPSETVYDWGLIENNYTGTPLQEINLTVGWVGASWYFNYTDGINSTYPPPVVWMKPEWLITNSYSQIMNYTSTRNGNDLYIKYIYVIHGYWLEIAKNISNIGEDQYQIDILVENIGNGWTPQYERVTVYDFVPNDFIVWNMTIPCPSSQCTNLSVGTAGTEFYGESYRWDIPYKGSMNSSLGPKVGPQATHISNYSWNVSYKVNGTGPYRVTDLYVVGLDPLRVDGASVSPVIAVITGVQTYTKEIIYVGIVAFLIVVNVSNLIITNKINRKLDGPGLGHK